MSFTDLSIASVASLATLGPRERALEEGLEALGDADLLAILLGTGLVGRPVALVAADLLHAYGGFEGLARLGPTAIAEHPGVGPAKALRIAASLEIGRRIHLRTTRPRESLHSSANVSAYFGPRLASLLHEEMWVLSLDGRNGIRGMRRVAQGGLHGCSVGARDILRAGLADAASAIVLVHNHPSGDPEPSMQDIVMTRAVSEAAAVVGVPLVDHVIVVGDGRHRSLLDLGILEPS